MASGGNNFNLPPDVIERRDQTKLKIENELKVLEKRMNRDLLNDAVRQASDRDRKKYRSENVNVYPGYSKNQNTSALRAGESERARIVAEERRRLMDRGELNIPTRDKYIGSLEERRKSISWKTMSDQEKHKLSAFEVRATTEMEKELGPSYKLTPDVFKMPKKKSPEITRKREH